MKKITIASLTPEDIARMSYNELIGITRETNRPPGGLKTVKTICRESFLDRSKQVLEIGTSTGFTAIEMARLVGAKITAIDINQLSLDEATNRARIANVEDRIRFEKRNAMDLPYENSSFDMVFCGNVTSYIPDRNAALREYTRVLKDGGFLAAVPMYYTKKPSESLVDRVSEAIKFRLVPEYKSSWISFFNREPFVSHYSADFQFDTIRDFRITEFVSEILASPHLAEMKGDTRSALSRKYESQIKLFGKNLAHMGYTVELLRKEEFRFDSELFTSSPK